MNKITKEQAEEWLGIAQSGLIGREYRDVFLRLPEILQSYLAQEEELESLKVEIEEVEMDRGVMVAANGRANKIIDQLKAENQALKTKGEQLCCRVGVLEMEKQKLQDKVDEYELGYRGFP